MRQSPRGAILTGSAEQAVPPTSDNYSGSCSVIDDGNGNWRMKLTGSGTLTLDSSWACDIFLVGGGGGGGSTHNNQYTKYGGVGGNGGQTELVTTVTLAKNVGYTVTIGAGGNAGAKGNDTTMSGNGSTWTAAGGAKISSWYNNSTQGGCGGGGPGTGADGPGTTERTVKTERSEKMSKKFSDFVLTAHCCTAMIKQTCEREE